MNAKQSDITSKQNAITANRALLTIAVAAAMTLVAALFTIAMLAGVEVMIALVVCVALLSYIAFRFSRALFGLITSYAVNKYHHAEVMAEKGIIVSGRGFPSYSTKQAQLPAPQQAAPVSDVRYSDPRRAVALKLLNATLDSDKYGPRSVKVMTQADAAQVGIIADDWSSGVGYLCAFFNVVTGNKGTLITNDKTASRIMADVASVARDVTDSAVGALPESNKR